MTMSLPVMTHAIQPSSPIVSVTLKENPETTLDPKEGNTSLATYGLQPKTVERLVYTKYKNTNK